MAPHQSASGMAPARSKYARSLLALLVLFALLEVPSAAKLDGDVVKDYEEFFNFGGRKIATKLEREKYENTIVKSKVDVLGGVFKKSVDVLKSQGILDLVFLIDASSSVGEANFKSELKFVKKLLSDVTVDYNHTRVAVVTFSSQNCIITNIDEISKPKEENNKCLLLNNEINEIKYTGGGTFTLGAFKVAQNIFKSSRSEAKKVLFLITDGFSNGGDPVPTANMLKEDQVTIFTIGVISGNYKELYELSSEPGELYSYLLDSFEEFESLARRALHVDLQSGDYIPLGTSVPCNHLCEEKQDCCDSHALCTCGTSTGHYNCLCELGYYGSGLKNSCSPCPSGSYASGPNLCLPCPDIHHYTKTPATGIESCTCKAGYQATENMGCEVIKCSKLSAPENGYFVKRKECSNVLNSACGVRCNVGYTLSGSSIRLCQANATWSGLTPTCQVKTCNKLSSPPHGSMLCKHSDLGEDFTSESYLPVDTVCSFKCERGRTLVGSSQRSCLPLAQWDGLRTACKQIKCNKLSKVNFGSVEPKTCNLGKQPFGKKCSISCNEGFEIRGPTQKICNGQHGVWDNQEEIFCKDVTKPILICPGDVKGETLPGKPYGVVTWTTPNITDNSGLNVSIWTKPAVKNKTNFKFKIGRTQVTYFAQDGSGNKGKCSFNVTIEDREPPTIEACLDPPPFLTLDKDAANITWDEPNIFDNSQNVHIDKSSDSTTFPIGTTSITYTATDFSNNTNSCTVNITVQESKCEILPDPIFGHSECRPFSDSIQCVVTCEEGYALPMNAPIGHLNVDENSTYICEHSQPVWYNQEGGSFPECSVTEIPTEIKQTGVIETVPPTDDVCKNSKDLKELGNDIGKTLVSCEGFDCNLQTNTSCIDAETEEQEESTNVIKRGAQEPDESNIIKRDTASVKKGEKKRRKKIRVKFQLQAKRTGRGKSKLMTSTPANLTLSLDHPRVTCPLGSFNRKYRCVICPEGTFHNVTANICQSCKIGTYNDKTRQTSCQPCPINFSTRRLHAKSPSDCIEQCPPGSYARKKQIKHPKNHPNSVLERITLKPYCSSCPLGHYQAEHGKLSCLQCPTGYTTYKRGSASIDDCTVQPCSSDFCNGGRCILQSSFYYYCECLESYIGAHCEIELDPCSSNPCQNQGICVANKADYTCECSAGFTGKHCNEVVDKCSLDCKNNATCAVTDEDEVICLCLDGFHGQLCETKIRYCKENLCENGECVEQVSGYHCNCRDGYIGRRCSYLPCDYQPCPAKAVCVNLNKGSASNRFSFSCECLPGFSGSNCTEEIDLCASNPCKNRGSCNSIEGIYKCECAKGYNGKNCEVKLKADYILSFPRSSITDFITIDGFERNLTEISVCLWMKTEDNFNYGTILSYATKSYDNAFTITDYTGLVLYVNNKYVVTDVLLNDGLWHHFCTTWSSLGGHYVIYLDGNIVQSKFDLGNNHTIEGGGKLVIGQEQDVLGGKFSQSESFTGKITHLDVYSRILTPAQITAIMNSCEQEAYYGDLYAWPEVALHIRGDIKIENSTFCTNCPEPEPLYHGAIIIEDNIAFYKCNKGYELNDAVFTNGRKCTKAAKWEGNGVPFCKPLKCGYPGYFKNGFITAKGYSYLDEIHYRCRYGFNLTGSESRVCWDDGKWRPEEPKCVGVQCERFSEPKNSLTVVLTDDELELPYNEFTEDFNIGAQVHVNCTDDSVREGESFLTCLNNGTWDFPPPTCKLTKPEQAQPPCPLEHLPPAPENGYIVEESVENVTTGRSSNVEYKCRRGYRLVGVSSSTCIIDGYWTELKMSCVARLCNNPPKLANMALKEVEGPPQVYKIGYMATYECSPGYKAFGSTKVRCLLPGVWSRMQAKCIRISCGKPAISAGTQITGNYLYNDKVQLVCGGEEKELQCGSDGLWKGDLSNC